MLDALATAGMKCGWEHTQTDPGLTVDECAKWNTYLVFSPAAPGADFVDYVRKDPGKFKGLAYTTGDHWVMVGEPAVIVEMSRSIGGDGGRF